MQMVTHKNHLIFQTTLSFLAINQRLTLSTEN